MLVKEWLLLFSFRDHPFDLRDAEQENDLHSYLVAAAAFSRILDPEITPRSSVFAAGRGAGKTAMRRMFEHVYGDLARRYLLVNLSNWKHIAHQQVRSDFVEAVPHLEALSLAFLKALAASQADPPPQPLDPEAESSNYFAWLAFQWSPRRLRPEQLGRIQRLIEQTNIAVDLKDFDLFQLSVEEQAEVLGQISSDLGYRRCYILIDGVEHAAADDSLRAGLVLPLINNPALNRRLYIKYFLSPDTIRALRQFGVWPDSLRVDELTWSEDMLKSLIEKRLIHYSPYRATVNTLESFLAPNVSLDLTKLLVQGAQGSPRRLIKLIDDLFKQCADEATDRSPKISADQIERFLKGSWDMTNESTKNLLERLQIHRGNLATYLKQQARYGDADVPIKIVNGITEERRKIGEIKAALTQLGVSVPGHPDDQEPAQPPASPEEPAQPQASPEEPAAAKGGHTDELLSLPERAKLADLLLETLSQAGEMTIARLTNPLPLAVRTSIRQTGPLRGNIIDMLDQLNSPKLRTSKGDHPLLPILDRAIDLAGPFGLADEIAAYRQLIIARLSNT